MHKQYVAAAALLLSMSAAPMTAHSGAATGGATEVTQILNNIELLMQSAEMENQTATALQKYATQLEQYQIMQKQIASGQNVALTSHQQQVLESRHAAEELATVSQDFYQGLERLHDLGTIAQQDWGARNLTWDEYIEYRQQRSEQEYGRRAVLSAEEARIMEQVSQQGQTVQQFANEIPRSQGEHEALQIMNGQINMLVGTLQEQLRFDAQISAAQSEERMYETERRMHEEQALQAQQRRFEYNRDASRRLREALRGN